MTKRNLLSIHKWLGLVAGIFVLILGLTGSILVFDDEIERFIHRDVIYLPETEQAVSLDNAWKTIERVHPNWDTRFTAIPEQANRAIEVELRRPDDRRYLYLHPATGEILRDLDSYDTFSYWMLKLHYTLHAGFFGEVLLLIVGIMFIGSLITGFWFYRKAIWKVLMFKIRPRFRDLKTGSSELHRSVGVWALIFNLITAITGVVIMFIIVQTNAGAPEPAPQSNPPAITASIDSLISKAQQTYPGFDPSYVSMPRSSEGLITFYGRMESDLPIHYKFSNYVQFDPHGGTEQHASFIQDQSLKMHLLSITYPLHFGDWGGIPIKLLYCFFGLAPAILSITGFIIWRKRQHKKARLTRIQRIRREEEKIPA